MRRAILIAVAFSCLSQRAWTDDPHVKMFVDGNALHGWCQGHPAGGAVACTTYIEGVLDRENLVRDRQVCLPENADSSAGNGHRQKLP